MWFQEWTPKRQVFRIDWTTCLNTMMTIVNSMVGIIGQVDLLWLFNKHKNIHFDIKWDNHMNSKTMKKVATAFDLKLLTHLIIMSIKFFGHHLSKSWCFQFQPLSCYNLSVFCAILRYIPYISLNSWRIFLKSQTQLAEL